MSETSAIILLSIVGITSFLNFTLFLIMDEKIRDFIKILKQIHHDQNTYSSRETLSTP